MRWVSAPSDCAVAPEPDRPGSGLVGLLDPTPGVGDPASVYGEMGYAGLSWHTYDVCERADAGLAAADTWVGNALFNAAKVIVSAAAGLHRQLAAADQFDGVDAALRSGIRAAAGAVATAWLGPALLVVSGVLLWLLVRGETTRQLQRVLVALVGLVVGGALYAGPTSALGAADAVVLDGVSRMPQSFLREVGVDGSRFPQQIADAVVYANWLRGQFGSADTAQARELGRDLLRAQAYTRAEIADGADGRAAADRKRAAFTALAGRAGDRSAHVRGVAGGRVGAGAAALLQAVALAAFPAAAALVVFVALIVLRVLLLAAPVLLAVAVLRPEALGAVFRLGAGALVDAVLAGALAALHTWLVGALLRPDSGVAPLLCLVVSAVASVLCWAVIRPFRRLRALGTAVLPARADAVTDVVAGVPRPPLALTAAPVRAVAPSVDDTWSDHDRDLTPSVAEPTARGRPAGHRTDHRWHRGDQRDGPGPGP